VSELEGLPELTDPAVIAAFAGWNDAADAATSAIDHLADVWDATLLGELDPDPYYDFQVNRPIVSLEDGLTRRIEWPTTRLYVARPPGAGRDLLLIRGLEPNMRWREFCAEILAAIHDVGADLVVTLGALLSDAPHTRPLPVTGSASDASTAAQMGVERSRYEGPTGIVGVFQDACARIDLTAVSLWAHVPHYVAQPPCPRATLALLHRVEELLDVAIPLEDLPDEAEAWLRSVDELAAEDSEIAEYVAQLEARIEEGGSPEATATGDQIAEDFERYLRRRGTGRPD
jgi:predicted ATP-grasp superfamily ATP-dependent carboligase